MTAYKQTPETIANLKNTGTLDHTDRAHAERLLAEREVGRTCTGCGGTLEWDWQGDIEVCSAQCAQAVRTTR